jgi:hypothetical protein
MKPVIYEAIFGGENIRIEINVDVLVYEMGKRVILNDTGKTQILFGAVKAQKLPQNPS